MQAYVPLYSMRQSLRLLFCALLAAVLSAGNVSAAPSGGKQNYTVPLQVAAGTNLITLAREYCHNPEDWQTIARINKLTAPYIIYADGEIEVPLSLLKMEELSLEVVTVSGKAVLQRENGKGAALTQGMRIAPGETVMTGEESFVQLLFPNGVYTRIDPESALTLSYLLSLADGKIKAEGLLSKGKLTNTLKKQLRFNDSMRTRTPVVITGIRGTEYRLKADGERSATVETLEGVVSVQSGSKTVRLRADQGLKAQEGRRLGVPQALPVPPAEPAIEEVYRTLPAAIQVSGKEAGLREVRLRLSSDPEGQATVYENSARPGEPVKVQELPDGRYYAFFTVTDKRGFESREQGPHNVLIRTMPPAPMVTTPRNGSIMWGKIGEMAWLESEQAVQYRAQVSRDAAFTEIVDDRRLDSPAYATPELSPGSYYFRVQALAADGFASNFSNTLNWEQKEAPAMAGMETTTKEPPVLQWHPMGDGWKYDLQVATNKEFSQLLIDRKNMAETSFVFPEKLDPGKYYVHLRGLEEGDPPTPWTPAQTMTVKNEPKVLEGTMIGAVLLGIILLL